MSNEPEPSSPGGQFQEGNPARAPTPAPREGASGQLSPEDLIVLNEEIAAMARAGLPLDQGLHLVAREMGRGRLQKVTQQLADDLAAGLTLPEAIQKQPGSVPPYYAALLTAGIRSGRLSEVLATLTLYARSLAEFRGMIANTLIYPAIIFGIGIFLIVFVCIFILPIYVKIFDDFRMKLPLATQVLVYISNNPLPTVVLPPLALVGGFVGVWLSLRTTPKGRILWARFVNAVPIIGTLVRSARLAAFADLLGLLVEQSVPLPEALRLAAEASSDVLLHEGAKGVEADLRQGMPLGAALFRQRLVPDLVVWMIGFGEKQGSLGAALRQLAQLYRRQAEQRAALLRTVLPPLLILLLASVLVLMFVYGTIAPMFELLDGLGGGFR